MTYSGFVLYLYYIRRAIKDSLERMKMGKVLNRILNLISRILRDLHSERAEAETESSLSKFNSQQETVKKFIVKLFQEGVRLEEPLGAENWPKLNAVAK